MIRFFLSFISVIGQVRLRIASLKHEGRRKAKAALLHLQSRTRSAWSSMRGAYSRIRLRGARLIDECRRSTGIALRYLQSNAGSVGWSLVFLVGLVVIVLTVFVAIKHGVNLNHGREAVGAILKVLMFVFIIPATVLGLRSLQKRPQTAGWYKKIRWWGWILIILFGWWVIWTIARALSPKTVPPTTAPVVEVLKRPVHAEPVKEAVLIWKMEAWHLGFDPSNTETQRFRAKIYRSDAKGLPTEFETRNSDNILIQWKVGPGQEVGSWHQSESSNNGYWYLEQSGSSTNAWSGKWIGKDGDLKDPDSWVNMKLEVVERP